MAFVPAPGTAMIEIVQLCQTQRVENTLYFQSTGTGWTQATLLSLADDILSWWDANMANLTSTASRIVEIAATDLESDTAESVSIVPTGGRGVGGNIDEALPNNVTLCISFRTSQRGRSARGRNYTIGLTTAFTAGSLAEPGYVTALQSAYMGLFTVASDNAALWSVVSRFHNKVPRTVAQVLPVIAAVVTDVFMDSQRRRLVGRGS